MVMKKTYSKESAIKVTKDAKIILKKLLIANLNQLMDNLLILIM